MLQHTRFQQGDRVINSGRKQKSESIADNGVIHQNDRITEGVVIRYGKLFMGKFQTVSVRTDPNEKYPYGQKVCCLEKNLKLVEG